MKKFTGIVKHNSLRFYNIEEIANFFNSVDTEDLQWEDTDLKFERPEMVHISVRIPKNDLLAAKMAARKLGLGYTAYIRMVLHRAVSGKSHG